jgi:hypothetical protein
MSTPRERIETELKAALKAKDKERLGTLRMLLSEIKNEQIRSGQEVDEPTFLKLVQKAVKQRHDSAEQYRKGDREELAEKEEREAEILEAYLPAQASEDEIRSAIEEFVKAEGLSGPAAIGPVMKAMMSRFSGQADGGPINCIAREVLS